MSGKLKNSKNLTYSNTLSLSEKISMVDCELRTVTCANCSVKQGNLYHDIGFLGVK